MATVFQLFKEISYDYYLVNRGTVLGNTLDGVSKKTLKGVFKCRNGYTRSGMNMETMNGDMPTLHVHPEDFEDADSIVGNAVIIDNIQYEVKGYTVGRNFDTGVVEHLTLTLQRAEYASE